MYERGTLFSYLYPFNEKFYGKFGYARCCDQMLWTLDMTRLPSGDYPGTFHLYDGGRTCPPSRQCTRRARPGTTA